MGFIGDLFAGRTKQTSAVTPQLSGAQKSLTQKQLSLADFQLEELERQRTAQDQLFDPAAAQASEFERLLSEFTGSATPEQESLINEAVQKALEAGESDISRFQSQATEQLREELAPSLGLRPGDTPILDRGSRIAAESARQQGQLVSKLGLGRAASLLEFPMAIQDFQSRLRSQAFANRLQLSSNQGSLGLGLAGVAPNVGAVLANQGSAGFGAGTNPALGTSQTLGGIGALMEGVGSIAGGMAMSSREFKKNNEPIEGVLEKLESLPVEKWAYKMGISDGGEHIGPYAEDFKEIFGIGDGVTINLIDAVGISLAAIKELSEKVKSNG